MQEFNGILVNRFNIDLLESVGTLLFSEFPTTLVFSDTEKNPVIKEWVDSSDDGKTDRFFYYKTSKYLLKCFIDQKLPHQDLIMKAIDGLLYFQDIQNGNVIANYILSPIELPLQYKPSSDYYADAEDLVNSDIIYSYFKLQDEKTTVYDMVKEISKLKKQETLNIHLLEGKGVGYGSIGSTILGNTLINFDGLYEEIGLDTFIGTTRGKVNKSNKESFKPFVTTEVYERMAASYSLLIRPKDAMIMGVKNVDTKTSEIIFKKTFDLISHGLDIKDFQEEYKNHSDFTIESFKVFLEGIYSMGLDIELNWFNPENSKEWSQKIDYKNANIIITNIEKLEVINEETLIKIGKFREINLNTRHFTFLSNYEEEFKGYFDKSIKEDIATITFPVLYEIRIDRKTHKKPDKPDNTEGNYKDTIMAYYPSV